MSMQDPRRLKETLNRTAKIDVDSGLAPDFETAVRRLRSHRIQVIAGPEVKSSLAHQAALLTVVNIARRFALGGVLVSGDLEGAVAISPSPQATLESEVRRLGGTVNHMESSLPTIIVGSPRDVLGRAIFATFEGWKGGVVKASAMRLAENTSVIPAAVLAGALAASEAFGMLRGDVEAGRRSQGLSLWRPDGQSVWTSSESDGPAVVSVPDHLWVLGLGHLGQAFLWTLMMCPFPDPARVRLTLQDMDRVTPSTDSTSILTQNGMEQAMKTRAVAEVLEKRGFITTLVERPFDGRFEHDPAIDPSVLVCGVDNGLARSRLEGPKFPFVVEAGIGHRVGDYQSLRVHTFPSARRAATIWGESRAETSTAIAKPAYQRIAQAGGDVCGLALLAGTAVGAPFVGTIAATLMLAQVMRLLAGDAPDAVVDLDLRALKARRALVNPVTSTCVPSYQLISGRHGLGG